MPNRAAPLVWNREGAADGRGHATDGYSRRLSREAVVEAAIRVADAYGLNAVTMRRVGGELGVPAGTLYSYVASKDDLLELMANELVGLTLAQKPLPEDWREALCELSRRMHAAFVTHPWALEVFARRPRMGPNSILRAKQLARAVSSLELEPDELWTLLAIVDDYVIGNALRMAIGAHERSFDGTLTGSDLVEFPELAALPTAELTRTHLERFETGLRSVLNGVEQEFLARRRAC